jgi:hypothetical protein
MFTKKKMNYSPFKNFIFRIPVFPFNKTETFSFDNPIFNIGIKQASPVLYEELKKSKQGKEQVLYKYKNRTHNRATPFGYFGALGIGEISNTNSIILKDHESYLSTKTRLDMNFILPLLKEIEKDKNIQPQLNLFINNTIYKVKNSYRYIEYKIHNYRRSYSISEIESSELLDFIVETTKNNLLFSDILTIIQKKFRVEQIQDVVNFINELIDCQFLTTNLEPKVTGSDLLNDLILFLESSDHENHYKNNLKEIKHLLNKIDSEPFINRLSTHSMIENSIKKIQSNYNSTHIVQTDTIVNTHVAKISEKLIDDLKKSLTVLNKITPKSTDIALIDFKKNFYKRYDNEFISLAIVLDTDLGIGISSLNYNSTDISPIINGISNRNHLKKDDQLIIDKFQSLLLKKYNAFLLSNLTEIELTDTDLIKFNENWTDLPDTINVLLEVIDCEDNSSKPNLFINSAHGTSAANMISRFSHINNDFQKITQEICNKEKTYLHKDEVLAEIVHLPEDRVGNIVLRNIDREYEIPYLSQSNKAKVNQIPISDILVQVPDGKSIILWSKRLKKRIIPIHSSAYNYNNNSIPIFVFLSLIQAQDKRHSLYFDWGISFVNYKYLPRIIYNRTILSPKIWNIRKQYNSIYRQASSSNEILKCGNNWRLQNSLPEKVLLIEGGDKFLIEFTNSISIDILFKELEKRDCKLVEQFEYNNKSLISQSDNNFKNEIIINFFKDE